MTHRKSSFLALLCTRAKAAASAACTPALHQMALVLPGAEEMERRADMAAAKPGRVGGWE